MNFSRLSDEFWVSLARTVRLSTLALTLGSNVIAIAVIWLFWPAYSLAGIAVGSAVGTGIGLAASAIIDVVVRAQVRRAQDRERRP